MAEKNEVKVKVTVKEHCKCASKCSSKRSLVIYLEEGSRTEILSASAWNDVLLWKDQRKVSY